MDISKEDVEKDDGQQISDRDSESFDEKTESLPHKPTHVSHLYLFKFCLLIYCNHSCKNQYPYACLVNGCFHLGVVGFYEH